MKKWYALYVRSRHEFVTEGELTRKGICCFLPTVKKMSQWKDRKKLVEFPLFPGYIFAYVQPYTEGFINVLRTRGAVDLVASEPGVPTPVPDEEMDALMILVGSGQKIDVYPDLREGTRVRVTKGPLQGAVGTLENRDDEYKFMINIDILGRSVGVRVYADDIEAD
ncbi:MAG: UpxY family transcription antiterminator [Nitrospirae bacterium]|nr:UpxY family transcription antiterminator [Nitrospirota bacterium]